MKSPNFLSRPNILKLVAACAGTVALAGCEKADTKGTDNKFSIQGSVVSVGANSVQLRVVKIIESKGQAAAWFEMGGVHKVHDNYQKCNILGLLKSNDVGKELSSNKIPQGLHDVQPGESVQLDGAIRDSFTSCDEDSGQHEERPVYTLLQEIPR